MMSQIDRVIADQAYILDCLCAYRDITNSGDCNDCMNRECNIKPRAGQLVRYNCAYYQKNRKVVDNDSEGSDN